MALIIVILGAIVLQYAIMINKSPTDRKRDRVSFWGAQINDRLIL